MLYIFDKLTFHLHHINFACLVLRLCNALRIYALRAHTHTHTSYRAKPVIAVFTLKLLSELKGSNAILLLLLLLPSFFCALFPDFFRPCFNSVLSVYGQCTHLHRMFGYYRVCIRIPCTPIQMARRKSRLNIDFSLFKFRSGIIRAYAYPLITNLSRFRTINAPNRTAKHIFKAQM